MRVLILILFCLFNGTVVFSQTIEIESPTGGFTTNRITEIKGKITGYNSDRCTLVINGLPQTISVSGNRFSVTSIASPGLNLIELIAGNASKAVSFYAKVPSKDIKVLLTWDTKTDIDLWVIDPAGNKCYYSNRSTPLGGNLDTDVTTGYGPETFTMAKAMPGTYSVQVQYYNSDENPLTRVKVYVILYEGTSKEKRQFFEFAMSKEHTVYHITDFTIEED